MLMGKHILREEVPYQHYLLRRDTVSGQVRDKLKSDPLSSDDLAVGLKVRSSNGDIKQTGVILILKHESHSADFFYKTVLGELDVWIEIELFTSLTELEFPIFTNEGYVIEAGY